MNITQEGEIQKQYWTIGEVAEQLELAESNIRFWCDEFGLNVHRSKTKHRKFSLSDITKLHVIRILLHEQKFTVEGAKEKLSMLKFPMSMARINQEVRIQLSKIIAN
jgi:DNA-binding transcriptional MerR regulator